MKSKQFIYSIPTLSLLPLFISFISANILMGQGGTCIQDTLPKGTYSFSVILENATEDSAVVRLDLNGQEGLKLTEVKVELLLKEPLPQNSSFKELRGFGYLDDDATGQWSFTVSPGRKKVLVQIKRSKCSGKEGKGLLGKFRVDNPGTNFALKMHHYHGGIVEVVVIHGIRSETGSGARSMQVDLFPVPAQGTIHAKWPVGRYTSINIFDSGGKILCSVDLPEVSPLKLDLSALNNGLYFFQFVGPNARKTKLVKIGPP